MIIAGIVHKIKLTFKNVLLFMANRDTLLVAILFGVAISAFLLGLSANTQKSTGPKIVFTKVDIPTIDSNSDSRVLTDQGNIDKTDIFASRNGTKYYYTWCSSAGRVKPHNRVYYDTKEQAIASGKSLASSCKD